MKTSIFFLILGLSLSVTAQSNPCSLSLTANQNKSKLIQNYSAEEVDQFLFDLNEECDLFTSFSELGKKINLETNQLLKALLFVGRDRYEYAKTYNIPISKVFQKFRKDYDLPIEQKSDEIWTNFVVGYSQIHHEVQSFSQHQGLSLETLKKIHKGFYQYSLEIGDHSHEPYPGQLLYEFAGPEEIRPWWTEKEYPSTKTIQDISSVNENILKWNLFKDIHPVDSFGLFLIRLDGRDVYRIPYAYHPMMLTNLVNFINQYHYHLNYKMGDLNKKSFPLMSPIRFSLYVQKILVSIHPFSEGNGRTSRFIQDMILKSYGLPSAPSGELSDHDILSSFESYYLLGIQAFRKVLVEVSKCTVKENFQHYDCRIL